MYSTPGPIEYALPSPAMRMSVDATPPTVISGMFTGSSIDPMCKHGDGGGGGLNGGTGGASGSGALGGGGADGGDGGDGEGGGEGGGIGGGEGGGTGYGEPGRGGSGGICGGGLGCGAVFVRRLISCGFAQMLMLSPLPFVTNDGKLSSAASKIRASCMVATSIVISRSTALPPPVATWIPHATTVGGES